MIIRILAMAALATLTAAAGCKKHEISPSPATDLMTPRATALAMHQAIETKDYDALAQCIAPEYRKPFRNILNGWKKYSLKAVQTSVVMEDRIGPEYGQRLRAELEQIYRDLVPSPLALASKQGQIAWEEVQITQEDDRATVKIGGDLSPFHAKFKMVRVGLAWYAAPWEEPETFAGQAKHMGNVYDQFTKQLNKLQGNIKKGKVTADNVDHELWPGQAPTRN